MMITDLIKERVNQSSLRDKIVSPEEAADLVKDGMCVATSGSISSGYPISFFNALSKKAETDGLFKIDIWSAAPLGPEIDGNLVNMGIVKRRLCHQSNTVMARAINNGEILYSDTGTYSFPNQVRYGYLGDLDLAVIEAVQIMDNGNVIPSSCVADGPTLINAAKKVIIEINTNLPIEMAGIHDIIVPANPPKRKTIPINSPGDRVGTPYISIDSAKIAGIIISREPNRTIPRQEINEESQKIAQHLVTFFHEEIKKGRMPKNLFPLQTGLGALGEAILRGLGKSNFKDLQTFSALLGDSILDLIDLEKIKFASGTGLFFSSEGLEKFYQNIVRYKQFILLRPVDISTYPELIQRLGVIALNGAIEMDIYGHINSSHIGGGRVVSGVAGSIEYARNGSLSIFMAPSIGKKGAISRIVPMVTHVDHTEHDVHIIITEQGLADLRGLDPRERALQIINNCAHPDYRSLLLEYYKKAKSEVGGHEPQIFDEAFSFHKRLKETGSMKC